MRSTKIFIYRLHYALLQNYCNLIKTKLIVLKEDGNFKTLYNLRYVENLNDYFFIYR